MIEQEELEERLGGYLAVGDARSRALSLPERARQLRATAQTLRAEADKLDALAVRLMEASLPLIAATNRAVGGKLSTRYDEAARDVEFLQRAEDERSARSSEQ